MSLKTWCLASYNSVAGKDLRYPIHYIKKTDV